MAGSLGYAERLSVRDDVGGRLGDPELLDEGDADSCPKVAALVELIRNAKSVVVHTGAGISTSAGIPDFRGPNGIWTLQKQGKPLPKASCPFDRARPTLTHQALLALHRAGKLTYLVSCNVDSLHLRSGFPRGSLAELHGNCFAERCEDCTAERVRDFEQATVGFKLTGRSCEVCGGRMRDQVLDWDDALPEAELRSSEAHSRRADVALTLGTSLQIKPACDLPLKTLRAGGALAIVNLQTTPHDRRARVLLRRRADDVMRALCRGLGLRLPAYERVDRLRVRHVSGNVASSGAAAFTLLLGSVHGEKCPLPWLAGADVAFPDGDAAALPGRGADGADAVDAAGGMRLPGAPPWKLRCRAGPGIVTVRVQLRLRLAEGCAAAEAAGEYVARLSEASGETTLHVVTDRQTYETEAEAQLADAAAAAHAAAAAAAEPTAGAAPDAVPAAKRAKTSGADDV